MRTLGSWSGLNGPSFLVDFKNIDEELAYLRTVVEKWRAAPEIRNLAVEVLQQTSVEPRDKKSQALALAQYVQNIVYYVHELPERFQTPAETLRLRAGDCDDTTVLVGALIESVGIPSALVAMKFDLDWRHIFPGAWLPSGGLLPLDTTLTTSVNEVRNPIDVARAKGKTVTIKVA